MQVAVEVVVTVAKELVMAFMAAAEVLVPPVIITTIAIPVVQTVLLVVAIIPMR
jgi:hypothetical protein